MTYLSWNHSHESLFLAWASFSWWSARILRLNTLMSLSIVGGTCWHDPLKSGPPVLQPIKTLPVPCWNQSSIFATSRCIGYRGTETPKISSEWQLRKCSCFAWRTCEPYLGTRVIISGRLQYVRCCLEWIHKAWSLSRWQAAKHEYDPFLVPWLRAILDSPCPETTIPFTSPYVKPLISPKPGIALRSFRGLLRLSPPARGLGC